MKICVAQTKPVKGEIAINIQNHLTLINRAIANGAEIIIFPELSITGYEPDLAKELAATPDDSRFDVFQNISNTQQVTIGIGVPTKSAGGICITLVIFQPNKNRETYSKKYLHADEEPYFVSGNNTVGLLGEKANIALAICYEISVTEHAQDAYKSGAAIYLSSVAKSVNGMPKALDRLSQVASDYSMAVLMANCVGYCDNFDCGGKTSVWNKQGLLVGQLNETDEGILIFDTETEEVFAETVAPLKSITNVRQAG